MPTAATHFSWLTVLTARGAVEVISPIYRIQKIGSSNKTVKDSFESWIETFHLAETTVLGLLHQNAVV